MAAAIAAGADLIPGASSFLWISHVVKGPQQLKSVFTVWTGQEHGAGLEMKQLENKSAPIWDSCVTVRGLAYCAAVLAHLRLLPGIFTVN